MSGKFMKVKKILVPTLTLLMVASQLTGCASATQKEMFSMMQNGETIAIEVANPTDNSQGTELYVEWKELASLDNYIDFRLALEDAMQIVPFGTSGKSGVIYVDAVGKHTNNSTLQYAFMNKKFINNVWNNETANRVIASETKKLYTDVTSDNVAILAGINAYYNLINDSEPGYANMYSTLTRLEAMSALAKATNPVQELNSEDFIAAVGVTDETAAIASLMNDKVYISTDNKSLDLKTANGTMTRAEFIYMLVNTLYPEDYSAIMDQEKIADAGFTDAKNGNNLAEKIKFTTAENPNPDRLESYLLSYCMQVENDKLPKELYGALVVAKNRGILGAETRWSEGIVKGEALNFMIKAFESKGTSFSVDRGESTGEAIGTVEDTREFDLEEFKRLCDPDVHCTYEDSKLVIDTDMQIALKDWSKPYYMMTTTQIEATASPNIMLYFEGVITKDQWYDFLLGDLDLNSLLNEKAEQELTGSTEADELLDQAEAEDPFNEEAYEKEQAEKIAEAEKAALEMLEQWAQSQNGGGSGNNSGNSSENNNQNQGQSSNNGGGQSSSNNQSQGDLENAPLPGGGSAGVDLDNVEQGDSIGKGTIGG